MEIKISHENIELTQAIKNYVEEKFAKLEKFMPQIVSVEVRLGKSTNHHMKGNVFECKANVSYPGGMFRAEEVGDDLYRAITDAEKTIQRQVNEFKESHRNH